MNQLVNYVYAVESWGKHVSPQAEGYHFEADHQSGRTAVCVDDA